MPPEPAPQQDDPDKPRQRASDRITGAFAARLRLLHEAEQRGDLAALRRMDPEHPHEPAFQRLLVQVEKDAHVPMERARRIALVAKILALPPSAEALGDGARRLGRAMAEAEVSEARVQVLMTARGEALDDAVLRLARRLARGQGLPFFDFGRLVLGETREVEETRYRIARDFWTSRGAREDADAPTPSAIGDTAP